MSNAGGRLSLAINQGIFDMKKRRDLYTEIAFAWTVCVIIAIIGAVICIASIFFL